LLFKPEITDLSFRLRGIWSNRSFHTRLATWEDGSGEGHQGRTGKHLRQWRNLVFLGRPILRYSLKLMPVEESDTKATVRRIKQEIDRLTGEQSQALKLAVYVGMTPDEAKQYDERLRRIEKLGTELW
jgi:hypothetical protein